MAELRKGRLILEITHKEERKWTKTYEDTILEKGDSIIIHLVEFSMEFKRGKDSNFRLFICENDQNCNHLHDSESFQLKEKQKEKMSDDEAIKIIQSISASTGKEVDIEKDETRQIIKGTF